MRVLLARRFRGNSKAAHQLGEEGEDPQEDLGEEEEEEKEPIAGQSSQGQGQLQLQHQTRLEPPKNNNNNQHLHQHQPLDSLFFTGNDSRKTQLPPKILSVVSPQQQKQSPLKKRRLAKSAQEENICKLRRRQASTPSNKEELLPLDKKPRAREIARVGNDENKKIGASPANIESPTVTDQKALPTEASRSSSSSSKAAPSSTTRSNSSKAKNRRMVDGGTGRNQYRRHGNSREGQEGEHLPNWQYINNNHHLRDSVVRRRQDEEGDSDVALGESEIIVPHTSETGYEGPLENDPASARGDVSTASPERQNHDNGYDNQGDSSSSARMRDGSFVINQLEETSSDDGSERGSSSSSQATSRNGSNRNSNHKNSKIASTSAEENRFRAVLKKERGLEIREQDGDGNCLFRAISLQVYGDPSMHGDVRKQCMDHMIRDAEHFSQFVTGVPFLEYVARTRQDGVHGNNPEIQASSELFNRPIEVFTPENGSSPLNIFHAEYKTGDVPIRLSYHDGNHYNAVIDPLVPTAGLGLGLPGLKPGYADKMQMAKAVAESIDAAADHDETELQQVLKTSQAEYGSNSSENDDDLQRAIKESQLSAEHMSSSNALSLSDMDATYFELEQTALERSLQSYNQKEDGKKQRASTTSRPTAGDNSKPKTVRGDHKTPAVASAASSSATASLPCPSQESIPFAAAAASSSVASAAARSSESPSPVPSRQILPVEEYPSSVQELVMNGFPLTTVVKAYDLVGNNFDHMLSLCLANTK